MPGRIPLALHRLVHGIGGSELLRAVRETAVGSVVARAILPSDAELRLLEVRRILDVFGVVGVEALGTESAATREVVGAELRLAELLANVHNSSPGFWRRVRHGVRALCVLSL